MINAGGRRVLAKVMHRALTTFLALATTACDPPEAVSAEDPPAAPAAADARQEPAPVQASGEVRRDDEALEQSLVAAKADPPDLGAASKAAQRLYELGRHDEALELWRIIAKHRPDDLDAAAKIVFALHTLGRHAEAAKGMEEVRRIFAASRDPAVKEQRDVVIDQWMVRGHRVLVREQLAPARPGSHKRWTAVVLDAAGREEFSVQVESSGPGTEPPDYGPWRRIATKRIEEKY